MSNFSQYADFGYTEITSPTNVRIFKGRHDWHTLDIRSSSSWRAISAVWQGSRLIVRTDNGPTFIFSDFNKCETIW